MLTTFTLFKICTSVFRESVLTSKFLLSITFTARFCLVRLCVHNLTVEKVPLEFSFSTKLTIFHLRAKNLSNFIILCNWFSNAFITKHPSGVLVLLFFLFHLLLIYFDFLL